VVPFFLLLGVIMVFAMHAGFAFLEVGTLLEILYALAPGGLVYWLLNKLLGLHLRQEEEDRGNDLSVHHIHACPEDTVKSRRFYHFGFFLTSPC